MRAKTYFDYLREPWCREPAGGERLASLTEHLGSEQAALGKLSEIVHQQAAIMAYNDAFHAVGIAWGQHAGGVADQPLPSGLGAQARPAH
jgi:DHA2 family multidrug resistance protein